MKIEITNRWAGLVLVIGIALTLTGGFAWAANPVPAHSATISACAKKVSGVLRLASPGKVPCGTDEVPIAWNQSGPAGISGLQIVHTDSGFGHQPAVTVSCPSGRKIIGGGYDTEVAGHPGVKMPQAWVNQNLPDGAGNQWILLGSNPLLEWEIHGYAICAVVQG